MNLFYRVPLLDNSKVEKSIIYLVKPASLATNLQNMDYHFAVRNTKVTKSANLNDCFFHILRYFVTALHNSTKIMMRFPAVLMNSPNSKVHLKGKRSIGVTNLTKS